MAKVLYIKASPREHRSYSVRVADTFIRHYKNNNPDDQIVQLDLFQTRIPEFNGLALQAKYSIMSGLDPSPDEKAAWESVEKVIHEFKSADKYVFAVPMWNFSIPYRLKHYLDVIVQPSYTFSYSPDTGYTGLVTGKPAIIFYARGGAYSPGTGGEGYDFQKPYVELILKFIGFTDIQFLVVEPTLQQGPEVAETSKNKAVLQAEEISSKF